VAVPAARGVGILPALVGAETAPEHTDATSASRVIAPLSLDIRWNRVIVGGMEPLLDALKSRVLVGDGAYGTLLSSRGLIAGGGVGPALNVTRPAFVAAAHREYLEAGAEVIETNTFAADNHALAAADVEATTRDVCLAGARIAREVAGTRAYVLGVIAPLSRGAAKQRSAQRKQVYLEQCRALLDGGVDALLLETFSDLDEIIFAVRTAAEVADGLPVIAQMAFTLAGTTATGVSPERMVEALNAEPCDVIGANCGGGESAAIESARRITELTSKPVSIYPNRGLADFDEMGRPVYIESHEYFARSAERIAEFGVNLIGGCCGTTPDDIRGLGPVLKGRPPAERKRTSSQSARRAAVAAPTTPMQPKLEEDLRHRRVVVAEVDPPRGTDATPELEGSKLLVRAGADAITIADNPLSIMRMSNLALATLLIQQFKARILLHIACRDRSLIGTQSHLLGAHALGISNILAVTGDPVATQAYQGSSGVFDMASHKLIELISSFNQGDFDGGKHALRTDFYVGGAFNCASRKLENEVRRFQRKIQAGARFVMTQPVFDLARAREVVTACAGLGVPLLLGVMPLVSERNAEFLHHEVPGIEVPEAVRKRMAGLRGEKGRAEGQEIARELMAEMAHEVQGFYLITPMNRYEIIAQLSSFAHNLPTR
jgi:methionine synthase / methylenetetrahydrofolate reductase(NADPH)